VYEFEITAKGLRHLNRLPEKVRRIALEPIFGPIAENPNRLLTLGTSPASTDPAHFRRAGCRARTRLGGSGSCRWPLPWSDPDAAVDAVAADLTSQAAVLQLVGTIESRSAATTGSSSSRRAPPSHPGDVGIDISASFRVLAVAPGRRAILSAA
jgi:hypothetical protein